MQARIAAQANTPEWSEIRNSLVTSTTISALVGLNKYTTKFELWHRIKEGIAVEFEPNERADWGNKLEAVIATAAAEREGWSIRLMKEFLVIDELRTGSSYDYCVVDADGKDVAIIEAKNVDGLIFKNEWLENDDGTLEAPTHIEIQVQWQMFVSGLNKAFIAALCGGNKLVVIERHRDEEIITTLKDALKLFWDSIDSNIPPEPDFAADAEFIKKLYSFAEPGSFMIGNEYIKVLAEEYSAAGKAEKAAKERKDAAKSEILTMIGACEKVKGDGYSISAGMIGPAEVSYTREGYRNFKITMSKRKGD